MCVDFDKLDISITGYKRLTGFSCGCFRLLQIPSSFLFDRTDIEVALTWGSHVSILRSGYTPLGPEIHPPSYLPQMARQYKPRLDPFVFG